MNDSEFLPAWIVNMYLNKDNDNEKTPQRASRRNLKDPFDVQMDFDSSPGVQHNAAVIKNVAIQSSTPNHTDREGREADS